MLMVATKNKVKLKEKKTMLKENKVDMTVASEDSKMLT